MIYRQIVRINSEDVDKATLDIIQAQTETIKTQQAQMEAMDKCVLELRTALAMAEKMIMELQDPHNIQ